MNRIHPHAFRDLYTPDGTPDAQALRRTTHMAIGAHPDDLEIMAMHGIGTCHDQPDKHFTGVIVTDGRGAHRQGEFADYSDDELAAARKHEQIAAADLGRYNALCMLGYPDAAGLEGSYESMVEDFAALLSRARPQVLYLHNPFDKHSHHTITATAAIEAVRHLPPVMRPKEIYGCEVWRGLDWVPDDAKKLLDVTPYISLQQQLIDQHRSQVEGARSYTESTLGRERANAAYADPYSGQHTDAATVAIDLMPLIDDPSLSLHDFKAQLLQQFCDETLGETDPLEPKSWVKKSARMDSGEKNR